MDMVDHEVMIRLRVLENYGHHVIQKGHDPEVIEEFFFGMGKVGDNCSTYDKCTEISGCSRYERAPHRRHYCSSANAVV